MAWVVVGAAPRGVPCRAMRLMRGLVYLAVAPDRLSQIHEIADAHVISKSHLMKVVQQLGALGYVHAVRRDDLEGKETPARCLLRPPLAQERVKLLGDGTARSSPKRPLGDASTAIGLDPLPLSCRLATPVPRSKLHKLRCGGVSTPAAEWRADATPQPPAEEPLVDRALLPHGDQLRHRCRLVTPGTPSRRAGSRPSP